MVWFLLRIQTAIFDRERTKFVFSFVMCASCASRVFVYKYIQWYIRACHICLTLYRCLFDSIGLFAILVKIIWIGLLISTMANVIIELSGFARHCTAAQYSRRMFYTWCGCNEKLWFFLHLVVRRALLTTSLWQQHNMNAIHDDKPCNAVFPNVACAPNSPLLLCYTMHVYYVFSVYT